MILAVHTVAGATIGGLNLPLYAIFIISFLSHFVLDIIPHGDEQLFDQTLPRNQRLQSVKKLIAIDITATIGFSALILHNAPNQLFLPISVGIFANLLPDFFIAYHEFSKSKPFPKFYTFHEKLHDIIKYQPNYSFLSQVVVLILFLRLAI